MHDWYEDTETPNPYDNGRCIHPGLFADGGPLGRTHLCAHCGQMVPNYEL